MSKKSKKFRIRKKSLKKAKVKNHLLQHLKIKDKKTNLKANPIQKMIIKRTKRKHLLLTIQRRKSELILLFKFNS